MRRSFTVVIFIIQCEVALLSSCSALSSSQIRLNLDNVICDDLYIRLLCFILALRQNTTQGLLSVGLRGCPAVISIKWTRISLSLWMLTNRAQTILYSKSHAMI